MTKKNFICCFFFISDLCLCEHHVLLLRFFFCFCFVLLMINQKVDFDVSILDYIGFDALKKVQENVYPRLSHLKLVRGPKISTSINWLLKKTKRLTFVSMHVLEFDHHFKCGNYMVILQLNGIAKFNHCQSMGVHQTKCSKFNCNIFSLVSRIYAIWL